MRRTKSSSSSRRRTDPSARDDVQPDDGVRVSDARPSRPAHDLRERPRGDGRLSKRGQMIERNLGSLGRCRLRGLWRGRRLEAGEDPQPARRQERTGQDRVSRLNRRQGTGRRFGQGEGAGEAALPLLASVVRRDLQRRLPSARDVRDREVEGERVRGASRAALSGLRRSTRGRRGRD